MQDPAAIHRHGGHEVEHRQNDVHVNQVFHDESRCQGIGGDEMCDDGEMIPIPKLTMGPTMATTASAPGWRHVLELCDATQNQEAICRTSLQSPVHHGTA